MKRLRNLVAVAALLAGAACQRASGPNVVLVTLDTVRADRLGAMGDAKAKTPVLDGLAARGTLFEHAYASAPLTLPSHTTILTGLDPNRHGVHDNGRFVVPDAFETVAERLHARGYQTAAFVTALVLDSQFGLAQGFDVYDDDSEPQWNSLVLTVPRRHGAEATDRALAWLERARKRPFFLWVHYYDVHYPRHAPPPFDGIADPYAGAISYVDSEVGRLLAGVERFANGEETLTVVVGDHGESLGDHDETTHGVVAYDSTLHVPLIVAGRGFAAGARSSAFVRTADVAPTILAAAEAPPFERADGLPLQTAGLAEAAPRPGYFEAQVGAYNFGWARIAGVREGRWKLTAEPEPIELYDVLADPAEAANRAGEEAELVARLKAHYDRLRPGADPSVERPHEVEDAAEKLAALGYISAPQSFAPGASPDPRRVVGILGWLDRARAVALEGRVPQSIQALEIFARESPVTRPIALRTLGPMYLLTGRKDEAIDAFEKLAEITNTIDSRISLAQALIDVGRAPEALDELERIAKLQERPTPRQRRVQARALLVAGRADEAVRVAETIVADDPNDDAANAMAARARAVRDGAAIEAPRLRERLDRAPMAKRMVETRMVLAALLRKLGRDTDAIAVLEPAKPKPPELKALLAEIAAGRGNPQKAIDLYREIVANRPATLRFGFRLAELYESVGRSEDALALYDRMAEINPRDAGLFVDRGALRQRTRNLVAAEKDYREALAIDAEQPEAAMNLALVLLATEREAEAEKWLLRAIEKRPDFAQAHFHLARLYTRRGDPRAADHSEKAALASVSADHKPGNRARRASRAPAPVSASEKP